MSRQRLISLFLSSIIWTTLTLSSLLAPVSQPWCIKCSVKLLQLLVSYCCSDWFETYHGRVVMHQVWNIDIVVAGLKFCWIGLLAWPRRSWMGPVIEWLGLRKISKLWSSGTLICDVDTMFCDSSTCVLEFKVGLLCFLLCWCYMSTLVIWLLKLRWP